ncbi:Uncharacterized protein TCM_017968 [Theobroma cacao]|uniref:Uncharacterized protein n=1 Tax=Theobroma cacao TaxID=3641 RepID=A0A061EFV8_THECC|nr:Uncharacterized protein TCM_017968 [Theobroma cacao]
MFRKNCCPNTPYSTNEGLLDFTAQSRYVLESESVTSNSTRFSSGSVSPRGKPLFKSLRSLARLVHNEIDSTKKNMNKMGKRMINNYRPRKVSISIVRHFPPGCGRGAAPISKEEFER